METVRCTGVFEGPDGRPISHPNSTGCGRDFPVDIKEGSPDDADTWDVKTDDEGNVISRHKSLRCPTCGIETFLVED